MAEIVNMPKLGFDMAEGTLVRWVIAEGEPVTKGQVLAEIETDKATVEVEANATGILLRQLVESGTVVPVNTPIAVIGQEGEKLDLPSSQGKEVEKGKDVPVTTEVQVSMGSVESPTEPFPEGVRASPLARRLAQEANLDLKFISGSGPHGRITKADVEAYLKSKEMPTIPPATPSTITPPSSPSISAPYTDQQIPLSKLRAIIGKRMVQSAQTIPHFFVTHEIDSEAIMLLR
ncbi:MAG: E3 binding domain-containing protein, partial [Anaerolineales bacterium]